jgi:uncharacterized membrane protein YecN with MAPEG domain
MRDGGMDASAVDASPDVYPLKLDLAADGVGLIRLDEAAYTQASFLDERLLVGGAKQAWTSWSDVRSRALGLSGESDFIFHMGHVGSTLLSRLVGDHERIFSLREPAVLRFLATAEALPPTELALHLMGVLKLFARVYRSDQRSLIKATSFARAILMYASPQVYINTILSGAASRGALRTASGQRLVRLRRRFADVQQNAEPRSEGELAALGWVCEVAALAEIATRFRARILWLDFDDFLTKPAAGVFAVLERLSADASRSTIDAMLASPHWGRYSKAPEHPYGVDLRQEILARGRQLHRVEVQSGLNWINRFATAHPIAADAIRMIAAAPKLG